jgi:hypothetical protein
VFIFGARVAFLQWVGGTVSLRIKKPEGKIDNLYIVPLLRMMGAIIPVHLWRVQVQLYTHEFEGLGKSRSFFFPFFCRKKYCPKVSKSVCTRL